MSENKDIASDLQAQVNSALDTNTPLCISAGHSKDWYGGEPQGQELSVAGHRGIVNYEPTELVITARAGTPLTDIEAALAEQNQQLPFEPPHFGETATLGGTIACNFSGPARPYAGAARDLVLGCRIINGKGEVLKFGGEVMKNVAGYDVSRLMSGAMGTLGVLLEVSLKVLPRPEQEVTLVMTMDATTAIDRMCEYAGQALPISAACHHADQLYLRLSGNRGAVAHAQSLLPGEVLENGSEFWHRLKEQAMDFFRRGTLWRLSVPVDAPLIGLDGQWLHDWGGAQRWLVSEQSADKVRYATGQAGGHATLFRSQDKALRQQAFHPLPAPLVRYQQRLKQAFDPKGIFNPQRLYPDF